MVMKIDLEKAYNRLKWSFIKMAFDHFGFPPNIVNLIMSYVSSTSTTILFNGNKLDSFHPLRGIRKGDSISLYLFLLCMEFFGSTYLCLV